MSDFEGIESKATEFSYSPELEAIASEHVHFRYDDDFFDSSSKFHWLTSDQRSKIRDLLEEVFTDGYDTACSGTELPDTHTIEEYEEIRDAYSLGYKQAFEHFRTFEVQDHARSLFRCYVHKDNNTSDE